MKISIMFLIRHSYLHKYPVCIEVEKKKYLTLYDYIKACNAAATNAFR